jgi:hypothetical protein
MTIGRGEAADLNLSGAGLSRLHASIHREGNRVWVLDEGSANGTSVNGAAVSPRGTPLSDGDAVQLGEDAVVVVRFGDHARKRPAVSTQAPPPRHALPQALPRSLPQSLPRSLPWTALASAILLGVVLLGGIAVLASRQFKNRTADRPTEVSTGPTVPAPVDSPPSSPKPVEVGLGASALSPLPAASPGSIGGAAGGPARILYTGMTREQQYEFLDREARRVTLLIGNRDYVFEREVLDYIKTYVDAYAKRVGNGSTRLWGEDLNHVFDRARVDAPLIIAAFRKEGVPTVVGLYIAMIETEYHECLRSEAGAVGLFQFIESTARAYGVSPDDRCRVEKMAPAAAKYMRDRVREFGNHPMSVALGIAGYNRDPRSVRRDLQDVLDSRSSERSFWTLLAKKEKLDSYFRNENVKYVPKFFAATIVGENPEAFGLRIRKLSTYDQQ